MGIPQRHLELKMQLFRERRSRLANLCPGSAFVLPARSEVVRNGHDVSFPFRQDSNFFYLTGFEEPDAFMIFRPGFTPEYVLFVLPKDLDKEVWNGFRYGPEGASREFEADQAYPLSEFDSKAAELLKPINNIYFPLRRDSKLDARFLEILERVRLSRGRTGAPLANVADPNGPLGELRLIKTADEIRWLKKACDITAQAHIEVMKACRPGLSERYLQGIFLGTLYTKGGFREGYNPIVAAGANATCLHYNFNDQPLHEGELLLIDAGAEFQYYTSDVTRTFAISGRFNRAQRELYTSVLEVQKAIIADIRPGLPFAELQTKTVNLLTEALIKFGLIKASRDEAIEKLLYKKYYPHGVSHYLGMDVHDLGLYIEDNASRGLSAGMTLTVEPGLYIPYDDELAPPEWRGLGVRIEDDILVGPNAAEVLTAMAPKEISDLENLVGQG